MHAILPSSALIAMLVRTGEKRGMTIQGAELWIISHDTCLQVDTRYAVRTVLAIQSSDIPTRCYEAVVIDP